MANGRGLGVRVQGSGLGVKAVQDFRLMVQGLDVGLPGAAVLGNRGRAWGSGVRIDDYALAGTGLRVAI